MARVAMGMMAAVLTQGSVATAQTSAQVALVYERPPPDVACRDEDWLRRLLAARLGHDPFGANAVEAQALNARGVRRAVVTVQAEGALRRVVVTLEGNGGAVLVRREPPLQVEPSRCAELARVAASVLITRMIEAVAPPAQTPLSELADESPPAPAPPAPPAPTPLPPPPPPEPLVVEVALSVGVVGGVTPSVAPSTRLGVWIGRHWWRLGVEAEGDLAVVDATWGGRAARGDRFLGAVAWCWRHEALSACAVFRGGAFRVTGIDRSTPRLEAHAEAAARVGGAWRVAPRWSLTAQVEGIAPLVWQTLTVGPSRAAAAAVWVGRWGVAATIGATASW